jgi:NADPH-dependent 2,4-dienoyl-CoA reductase/sulfur reductase-like enzyme
MAGKRLCVIGGVAAGASAAAKAKRTDPSWDVHVFEQGPYVSYGACGIPYLVAGLVGEPEDLIARRPEQFERQGVHIHVSHRVTAIEPAAGRIRVLDRQAGEEHWQGYDALVIATGARPIRPRFPGVDLAGIYTVRTLGDGVALLRAVEAAPRRALVVGGGYIGLEMADAFRARGLQVTVVELAPQVMLSLDVEMAGLVEQEVRAQGVDLQLGNGVEGFEGRDRVERVLTQRGTIEADLVVLAMGVRPEVSLAREAGVEMGSTGALGVDERMQTNLEGVWAAGDCAETLHRVTGAPTWIPLGDTANKQGRAAGENAVLTADGPRRPVSFRGVLGTAVAKVFDLAVARTGLGAREARDQGFSVSVTRVKAPTRAHYYPGGSPVHVQLVVEEGSGRLLGGQIVGRQGVAKRVDVLAALISAKGTVEDLAGLDLSYAPPFSPVWDPLLVAANVARK